MVKQNPWSMNISPQHQAEVRYVATNSPDPVVQPQGARHLEALHRLSEALLLASSWDQIVRETLDIAVESLHADLGSLQLYDSQTDTLVFQHLTGPWCARLAGHVVSATEGINGIAFRSGQSSLYGHVSDDATWNPAIDELTGYETRSVLTVPLKRSGALPLGVVQVRNGRAAFDARDLQFLELLCAQAKMALVAARGREQCEQGAARLEMLRGFDRVFATPP